MYVLSSAHDLFVNLPIKISQPKLPKENANGHRLRNLTQDAKDKLKKFEDTNGIIQVVRRTDNIVTKRKEGTMIHKTSAITKT